MANDQKFVTIYVEARLALMIDSCSTIELMRKRLGSTHGGGYSQAHEPRSGVVLDLEAGKPFIFQVSAKVEVS